MTKKRIEFLGGIGHLANVIQIDDYRPHSNTRMLCICGMKWIATHPDSCESLECPSCGEFVEIKTKEAKHE